MTIKLMERLTYERELEIECSHLTSYPIARYYGVEIEGKEYDLRTITVERPDLCKFGNETERERRILSGQIDINPAVANGDKNDVV